jgi:hypothetical protein
MTTHVHAAEGDCPCYYERLDHEWLGDVLGAMERQAYVITARLGRIRVASDVQAAVAIRERLLVIARLIDLEKQAAWTAARREP